MILVIILILHNYLSNVLLFILKNIYCKYAIKNNTTPKCSLLDANSTYFC